MYENVLENRRQWQQLQTQQAANDQPDDQSVDQYLDQSHDQSSVQTVIDQCVDQPAGPAAVEYDETVASEDSKLMTPSSTVNP